MKKLPTTEILGIPVSNASEEYILEFLSKRLLGSGEKTVIYTPNPEIVMHAYYNKVYQDTLKKADVLLADGVGLLWGANVLGKKLQSRITGVDFMKNLCQLASERRLTVGFVGGRDRIAEMTSERLKKSYKNLTVGFVGDDPDAFLRSEKKVDILFVALGAPKQEEWIERNLDKINAKVLMGVGGSFDYISGEVSRAPKWMREIGVEWLYRLVRQPWRWRRQLALVRFVYVVFKTRFTS